MKKILLLGAMPEEVAAYSKKFGDNVLVSETGVGKPAAAAMTQKHISEFKPDYIIFTGVAGSLSKDLGVGDIVIVDSAINCEMDVRSLDSKHLLGEQPFTGERIYKSDNRLAYMVSDFNLSSIYGATGSVFIGKEQKANFIKDVVPDLIDKETNRVPSIYDMESSAILQIANASGIPVIAFRAISDDINGNAGDFNEFIQGAVHHYVPIVKSLIDKLS